jgi:hypothetical protein
VVRRGEVRDLAGASRVPRSARGRRGVPVTSRGVEASVRPVG